MKRLATPTICLLFMLAAAQLSMAQKPESPELVVQTGHSAGVNSVAFSPDGKTLASGSGDNTIKLWDVSTGTELRTLKGHGSGVESVAFSPNGKTLATSSYEMIKLWDVTTGKALLSFNAPAASAIISLAFSPDGKMLVSGSVAQQLSLWNIGTANKLVRDLDNPNRHPTAVAEAIVLVAFSLDGKTVVSCGHDWGVKLWDVRTGKQLRSFSVSGTSLRHAALSADGKTLVSIDHNDEIKLWNVTTGKQLYKIEGNKFKANAFAFSHDGGILAGGGAEPTTKLWNVATGKELRSLAGQNLQVNSIVFSPDGKTLANGGEGEGASDRQVINLWDVPTGTQLLSLEGRVSDLVTLAFSPDNKVLVDVNVDRAIKLWDIGTGIQRSSINGYDKEFAFCQNGMLVSTDGNTIRLFDTATSTELRSFKVPDFQEAAFSPDGRTLALTTSTSEMINLWDVTTGLQLRSLEGLQNTYVHSLAFSPDGKTLACDDLTIVKLWDVATARQFLAIDGLPSLKEKLAYTEGLVTIQFGFSPDSQTLAIGGREDDSGVKRNSTRTIINLWDVGSGKQLRSFVGSIGSTPFSPDGSTLVSGSEDGTIKLWDVATGKQLRSLRGHNLGVSSAVFSPDGELLASSGFDAKITLWDIKSGQELATLISLDETDWAVLTPDGLFDGSPAAWRKMIWRAPQNTFDSVPVEAYFNDYYHPGLLADIFAGKRPKASSDISQKDRRQPQLKLTLADAQPVTLIARNLTVKIDIAEPAADKDHKTGAGAQDVRLFRNGSLVKVWRGDVLKGQSKATLEATIPIVAGENTLTAYAFNHDNIKSSDATLVVNGADTLKRAGTLYVLGIGSNEYQSKGYDLKFALAHVEEMSKQVKFFQDRLGTYAQTEIIALENQEATKANVMMALERFGNDCHANVPNDASAVLRRELDKIKSLEPEDALVIYYAGHGTAIGQHFYLLPHDFVAGSEAELKASSISDIELNDVLERVDAGKLLMVIDACQSGQALGGEKEGRGPMNSKGLAQLAYDKGMYMLTASQSYQAAQEVSRTQTGQRIEHGLLTFTLLEGLSKAKRDNEGRISERDWMNYAVYQVPLMQTEEMKKRNLENTTHRGAGKRGTEIVFDENDKETDPEKRNVQRPRVFYRRELEVHPLIVARR